MYICVAFAWLLGDLDSKCCYPVLCIKDHSPVPLSSKVEVGDSELLWGCSSQLVLSCPVQTNSAHLSHFRLQPLGLSADHDSLFRHIRGSAKETLSKSSALMVLSEENRGMLSNNHILPPTVFAGFWECTEHLSIPEVMIQLLAGQTQPWGPSPWPCLCLRAKRAAGDPPRLCLQGLETREVCSKPVSS